MLPQAIDTMRGFQEDTPALAPSVANERLREAVVEIDLHQVGRGEFELGMEVAAIEANRVCVGVHQVGEDPAISCAVDDCA